MIGGQSGNVAGYEKGTQVYPYEGCLRRRSFEGSVDGNEMKLLVSRCLRHYIYGYRLLSAMKISLPFEIVNSKQQRTVQWLAAVVLLIANAAGLCLLLLVRSVLMGLVTLCALYSSTCVLSIVNMWNKPLFWL